MMRLQVEQLPAERLLRLLLGGVAFAAGLTGVMLLAFPGSTARYFSWGLSPPPLAGLIGGSYVASLFVFGLGLRETWAEIRGLVAGTLALTLPILVMTFVHLDVFEFDRWQAWAWVFLFIASPLCFGTVLVLRRGIRVTEGLIIPTWARGLAAVLALVFLATAVTLWWSPERASTFAPFDLPPLGGRVLGCWASFLAFLAGWSAVRGRVDEVRVPLLSLVAFMAGALVGAMRSFDDLRPPIRRTTYILALAVLVVLTVVVASASRAASDRRPGGRGAHRR